MNNLTSSPWPSSLVPDKLLKEEGPPSLTILAKSIVGLASSFVISWGIIGNAGVCYIILKELKLSVTNLFLLNLSLADILMCILSGPFVMVNDFILGYWPFGIVMCKVMPLVQGISSFVGALTHVVISFDRFVVVYRPLKPRISQRYAAYILITIWIISLLIMLPLPIVYYTTADKNETYCLEDWSTLIYGNYTTEDLMEKATYYNTLFTILLMIFQYFLPLFVIVSTYSAIAFRIWIRETPGEVDPKRDQRIAKSKRKLLKMVIIVALLYGLSRLPRHSVFLVSLRNSRMWSGEYALYYLYTWLFCILAEQFSMGYNPLIYCWMNKMFRRGFIRICMVFFPCCVGKVDCFNLTIKNHRTPTDRNTFCASSNYEKTVISPMNTKKSLVLNAPCLPCSSEARLINQRPYNSVHL